jgi:hypothetical protein
MMMMRMMMMVMVMVMLWVLAPCRFVGRCKVQEKHTVCSEDGNGVFLRHAGIYLRVYTAPKSRKTTSNHGMSGYF